MLSSRLFLFLIRRLTAGLPFFASVLLCCLGAVVLNVVFSWRLPQSTKIIVSLLMRYVKVTGDNPSKDTAKICALKTFSSIQKIHTSRAQMCRRVGFFGAVVLFLRTVGPPLLPVPPWLPPRNRPLGFSTIHTQYTLRPSSKVWLLCMYCVQQVYNSD